MVYALKRRPPALLLKKKKSYVTLTPLPNLFVTLTSNLVVIVAELKSFETKFKQRHRRLNYVQLN